MKLTNKDKKYLLSIGYENDDFSIIEETVRFIRYELLGIPDIRISKDKAIKLLGRELFINGIGRATFHGSAIRRCAENTNIEVYFERIK